ncbi:MAG: ABC transporter ATP-binding protein [Clostridiales bacterium]|nr:ABC transporter ATP-binding protein [Clostridiales bacterium]
MENPSLRLENVCFSYDTVQVLSNINYEFTSGKIYAIVGKSGAGKTTLLSVLSGLASPTSGNIYCNDRDINSMNKYDYRRKYVGVIFQSFNLLTKLTAVENVELSMNIAGYACDDKRARAYQLLESVGLSRDESDRRILKLSGGQQQRVAIARALSYEPDYILADEPTGNLDGETQDEILEILRGLADNGKCVILVTHSPEVAKKSDVVYQLGKVQKAQKKNA